MADSQFIIACSNQGKFLEYIPKMKGHTGKGQRHLAITVLLYNKNGQVLLQKRKHRIFDNIWDLTAATHPLHTDGGDETLEQATWRCLEVEYGINPTSSGKAGLRGVKNLGFFNYFAKYGSYCENEHCAMMVGEYNGPVNLNPEAGYEYKWMTKKDFLVDLAKNPQNYTPWAKEGAKILEKVVF